MSSLIVEVCKISKIKPHPNADRMEIAVVKGWECCIGKDQFKEGEKCVYFPIDTILPESVSDKFGVTKYLSKGRIKAIKLRGYPSCGLVVKPEDSNWKIGLNVVEYYGCIKWEPPQEFTQGNAEKEHPLFARYTDIENIKNFPDIFQEGEEVVITEKIHGMNSRAGLLNGEFVAGSHRVQRKDPNAKDSLKKQLEYFFYKVRRFVKTGKWKRNSPKTNKENIYWLPFKNENLKKLIISLNKLYHSDQVIVFGEIFGKGVQDLDYGRHHEVDYRVFDILVNGEYLSYCDFKSNCLLYNIKIVPVIYEGKWKNSFIDELSSGKSLVSDIEQIREGIVIKPIVERKDSKIGRVILKSLSFEYLARKDGTEKH